MRADHEGKTGTAAQSTQGGHAQGEASETLRAKLVLGTDNLTTSIDFYTRVLEWDMIQAQEEAGSGYALLRMAGGAIALLTSYALPEDVTDRFADNTAKRLKPGDRFYVTLSDSTGTPERQLQLAKEAGMPYEEETEPNCWRMTKIATPEGYVAAYWQELKASDEEIVALFAAGPARLEAALSGLGEAGLDAAIAPVKWTVRQQVLHVVDLELAAAHKLKFALSSSTSGREYAPNRFTQDEWAEGMCYEARPIEAEVALFRALREHVLSLCRALPDALQRSVTVKGREETAGQLMKAMAGHANLHIRRIAEIRGRGG